MSTYLSIDLDFWNQGSHSYDNLKTFLKMVKKHIPSKNIVKVDSHEELLPYANTSGCNNLINVDWHSDISNRFDPSQKKIGFTELNCGTWINFIEFRKKGKFTWIHPHNSKQISKGYCHQPYSKNHNPFVIPSFGGWRVTEDIKSYAPETVINWGDITHTGISYSYDWTNSMEIYRVASKIIGKRPDPNPYALLGY